MNNKLPWGHGLFLEKNDVTCWKRTLEANAWVNNLSESTLLLLTLSLSFIHHISSASFSAPVCLSSSLCVQNAHTLPPYSFLPFAYLSLSLLPRPSCGGFVSGARPQPEAGGPKRNAEQRHWDRSGDRWLPSQWCRHFAQGVPGRAARASANA